MFNVWLPSGILTVCYWKWLFIMDFPMKHGDFNHSYVNVYQRVPHDLWKSHGVLHASPMFWKKKTKRHMLSGWQVAGWVPHLRKCYSRASRANLRLLWLWWLTLQGITGNQEYHITIRYIYIYNYIYIYMNTYITYTYVTIYCGKGGGQVSICE